MFYKIIAGGVVVDVLEGAAWVCLNKHGRPVHCEASRATGVISSDGSIIYHIDGAAFLGDYMDVIVANIDEAEAIALKEQLDIGAEVPAEPEAPETDTDAGEDATEGEDAGNDETQVMSAAAMRQRMLEQDAKLAEQDATIQMLTDCILEMSEVVYSGL
ncbi:MAG: hypothetical protein IKK21_05055 [Clostridia bacterium]|nr:hypothetical protein [Clostridia bacterium]